VYLDASALVKDYVAERGSRETGELSAAADIVTTLLVSRAEVAAALAKAVRLKIVEPDGGRKAQRAFATEWPHIAKVPVTEALVSPGGVSVRFRTAFSVARKYCQRVASGECRHLKNGATRNAHVGE
jgi:hypothetical protein